MVRAETNKDKVPCNCKCTLRPMYILSDVTRVSTGALPLDLTPAISMGMGALPIECCLLFLHSARLVFLMFSVSRKKNKVLVIVLFDLYTQWSCDFSFASGSGSVKLNDNLIVWWLLYCLYVCGRGKVVN